MVGKCRSASGRRQLRLAQCWRYATHFITENPILAFLRGIAMVCHGARLRLWILGCLLCGMSPPIWPAERLLALSSYNSPPFITDTRGNAGLSADLVANLNHALAGKYEIYLQTVPRVRLNQALNSSEKIIVLFVPSFLFGGLQGSYLWSDPLWKLNDTQEIVSRVDKPFELSDPASLRGVHFGAMQGHVFPYLADEIDAGRIQVDRAYSEISLIRMLEARHVDVITLPRSVMHYFVATDKTVRADALHFSQQNLGSFTRHLMFQKGMRKEREEIDRVLQYMANDPSWIEVLKKYGVQGLPD
jgi:hypothetical protein